MNLPHHIAFMKPSAEHRQDCTMVLEKKWSIFKKIQKEEKSRKSLTRPKCSQALGHSASAEAKARTIDSTYMTGRYCFYSKYVTHCACRPYDNALIKLTDDLKYIFTVRQFRNSVTFT